MYVSEYILPIIVSTYKSDYGKGRKDIIPFDTEFTKLSEYSLYKINKSIKVYKQVVKELHDISIHPCNPLDGKVEAYHEIIMRNLNLMLGHVPAREFDLIIIEHYFMDKVEKLEIIKSSKEFDAKMRKLVRTARAKNQFKRKRKEVE